MCDIKETVKRFKAHMAKMDAYNHAMGVLYYDSETAMPKNASEHMGQTLGTLSEVSYQLRVNDELIAMISEIMSHKDEVDRITFREAEEMRESLDRIEKIPMEEYVEFTVAQNAASTAWHEAKVTNNFALFAPHLQKLVDFSRRFAEYYAPGKPIYNTLLDQYEKGLTTETLDKFFADVRAKLVPLIHETQTRGAKINDQFLKQDFPIPAQREFSNYLMQVMTINRDDCTIGETEHPFTTGFCKHDVRITTHYHADMVASNIYSVIHEGGHALYELHIGDDLNGSWLACGASMSIHESQSRFYENIIGRSEQFVTYIFPKMQEMFPDKLNGITAHDFYLAVNKAEPSLVRTEADELTYSLHIMVRYELEKRLMDGSLTVDELPHAWNEMYKEYLGVDVPNDTLGVLQDSHWSGASFGYFPSYALGSAYGAQMLKNMEKELDVWGLAAKGELTPIIDWLTDKIYKYGAMLRPNELVKNACGAEFDPNFYIDYLERKFKAVYQL